MNCLLVVPPYNQDKYRVAENLGIKYLSSFLRKNSIDAKALDCPIRDYGFNDVAEEIFSNNYKFVGISILFNDALEPSICLAKKIKKENPNIKLCIGGNVPTFYWQPLMKKFSDIDFIVRGEGEYTLLELLSNINNPERWHEIKGLVYRTENGCNVNPSRNLIKNLDNLPFPDRDEFSNSKIKTQPFHFTVSSSRGCSHSCSFCTIPTFYSISKGLKWRPRSAKNVVDEIQLLAKNSNTKAISFIDDNFLGSSKRGLIRAEQIADELISKQLPILWSIECRVNDIEETLFRKLKRSGLQHIFLGAESGINNTLEVFNKKIVVNDTINSVNLLKRIGIDVDCHFITFHPYINFRELKKTIKLMKELEVANYDNITNELIVYEGAPLKEQLSKEGRLVKKGWNFIYKYDEKKIYKVRKIILEGLHLFKSFEEILIDRGFLLSEAKKLISDKLVDYSLNVINTIEMMNGNLNDYDCIRISEEIKSDTLKWLDSLRFK